jgi:hypothetical protein
MRPLGLTLTTRTARARDEVGAGGVSLTMWLDLVAWLGNHGSVFEVRGYAKRRSTTRSVAKRTG